MPSNSVDDLDKEIRKMFLMQESSKALSLKWTRITSLAVSFFALTAFVVGNIIGSDFVTNSVSPSGYEIDMLTLRIDTLEYKLNELIRLTTSATENVKLNVVANQVEEIKKNYSILSETILEDPNKALTSTLLNERQRNLDEKITNLSNNIISLNTKLENWLLTLFLGPLLIYIVTAFLSRFEKQSKNK